MMFGVTRSCVFTKIEIVYLFSLIILKYDINHYIFGTIMWTLQNYNDLQQIFCIDIINNTDNDIIILRNSS